MSQLRNDFVQPYIYYVVGQPSVTHRVLNKAEEFGTRFLNVLPNLSAHAREQGMHVTIAMRRSKPLIAFTTEATTLSPPRAALFRDFTNVLPLCFGRHQDLFAPRRGVLLTEWQEALEALHQSGRYRDLPAKIVEAAQAENINAPSAPSKARVSFGPQFDFAQAYQFKKDWIYRCPIDPNTNEHFTPPSSTRVQSDQIGPFLNEIKLSACGFNHRKMWDAVERLRIFDLK